MRQALLYCAGVGERWARGWPNDQPKQLVDVEGEILLERTCRQLRERDITPIVIAFDERLKLGCASFWTPPRETRWLVETIELAEVLCGKGRTFGLFGDAWFSDSAMDIIDQSSGLVFFGREKPSRLTGGPGECFGFAWDPEHRAELFEAIRAGVADAAAKDAGVHGSPTEPGAIWQPYRKICGFDMYDHRTEDNHWIEINDWTDDFDTPQRYRDWCARFERRWLRDTG